MRRQYNGTLVKNSDFIDILNRRLFKLKKDILTILKQSGHNFMQD